MVLEKILEHSLDCKEIKPVNPKGNQPWIFIGRTDVEAPILWPLDAKNWLIWKDSDAGKDWRWQEKRMTGWDGWMASPTRWTWVWESSGNWWWTGNGCRVCCSPWGCKKLDMTKRLNWSELNWTEFSYVVVLNSFVNPWTVASQASLSMGFSKQEYRSGLPFPPSGDLPNPGIEPGLPHCRRIIYWLTY